MSDRTVSKIVNNELAKVVGLTSAILFQHISYWCESQGVSVLFRTNEQLKDDLDCGLSVQQIQRAKKKLIDHELITISFDSKNKWNRTTYYRFTEKGESLRITKNKNVEGSKSDSSAFLRQKESKPENTVDNTHENTTHTPVELDKEKSNTNVPQSTNNAVKLDNEALKEHNNMLKESNKTATCIEDFQPIINLPKELESKGLVHNKQNSTWIPKHLYAKKMKEKRQQEKLNQEFIVPQSMKQSWEDGFTRDEKEVVKGVPVELLSDPRIAKMLSRNKKQSNI